MIVLDTNVVSELVRPSPDESVVSWVDAHPTPAIHLTSVSMAEVLYGVRRLPVGRRRNELGRRIGVLFDELFAERILPFDSFAAVEFADLVSQREAAGRPMPLADAQIAAICRANNCRLATRNERDFLASGVAVINPWAETSDW